MAGPDLQAFLHATRSPRAFAHAGWRVGFHAFDLATRRQGMQLVNGLALIARPGAEWTLLGAAARVEAVVAATDPLPHPAWRRPDRG